MDTPDVLPALAEPHHRPRSPHRRRTDGWKVRVALAFIALLSTVGGGYFSGLTAVGDRDRAQQDRLAQLETRVEDHYKAILARLDELKADQREDRQAARADINGIHDEIMRILRER